MRARVRMELVGGAAVDEAFELVERLGEVEGRVMPSWCVSFEGEVAVVRRLEPAELVRFGRTMAQVGA